MSSGRVLITLAAIYLLTACGSVAIDRGARWALDPNRSFYVARPNDDRYASPLHDALGNLVTQHYPGSLVAAQSESVSLALASARYAGADYVLYPTLGDVVERQGFWRSLPKARGMRRAMVDIRVHVFDAHTGTLLETTDVATTGGLLEPSTTPERGLTALLSAWATR